MSHFTVLVAVKADDASSAYENVIAALAPYDENLDVPHTKTHSEEEVDHAVQFYREHAEYLVVEGGRNVAHPDKTPKGDLDTWNARRAQCLGLYLHEDARRVAFDDGTFTSHSTWNEESTWDWWTLGGRWRGFFQLTEEATAQIVGSMSRSRPKHPTFGGLPNADYSTGPKVDADQIAWLGDTGSMGDNPDHPASYDGRADLARKRHIDFETKEALAASEADAAYDKVEAALKSFDADTIAATRTFREVFKSEVVALGLGIDFDHVNLDTPAKKAGFERARDRAKEVYHDQPVLAALKAAHSDDTFFGVFGEPVEDYFIGRGGREAYVAEARVNAHGVYAAVIDGQWIAPGKMGWFGMSSESTGEKQSFRQQLAARLATLDDDLWLALVDAHV